MNDPTIEIHGTGVHNHGAELMAIAIATRMRTTFPRSRIVVEPRFGPFEARARIGFLSTTEFGHGRLGNAMGWWTPGRIRRQAGIVRPAEIDVVLDASGFSFSDQWGSEEARRLVGKMNRRDRKHQPLVLLPQALGPFEQASVATWSRRLFDRASLVYARDSRSREYVEGLSAACTVRTSPDFTLSVEPRRLDLHVPEEPFAAVVPNFRMMDKAGDSQRYIEFLDRLLDTLPIHGFQPAIVLHDRFEDQALLGMIASRHAATPVLRHDDSTALKGVLSQAAIVVGSRYHALASAMSQGVPTIGCGWSHKYSALFEDFGAPEFLLSDIEDVEALDRLLSIMAAPAMRHSTREALLGRSSALQVMSEVMWAEIEGLIGNLTRAPQP